MSALVRITTGIAVSHSRVGFSRAMSQFGEVVHCHKPPFSGIPGEDFVNVRFANQESADRAYAALKANTVFVDGFQVGVGPNDRPPRADGPRPMNNGAGPGGPPRRRSPSPPRRYSRHTSYVRGRSPPRRPSPPRGGGRRGRSPSGEVRPNFPSRGDAKSASPRRMAREMGADRRSRSRSRDRARDRARERLSEAFSGGGAALALPRKAKSRTPSPEPLGPMRSGLLVKNPFFNADRSPSPEAVAAF
eukprot:TRINITY_DN11730_c0_g2_i9.p1 TRINITY_DN11730_c0_g2~~TRINITY_DN11730_c0_g2_i9.p1  ORF type:complete len:247 (-),score=7.13 TRINITY_DN11730_c0_g2_i9:1050-1790(-)